MALTQTRPEKSDAMTRLVYALRHEFVEVIRREDLNIAEGVNGIAQVMASVLAGAYKQEGREIVLEGLPHLIRAYFPSWDKIYADHKHSPSER